MTSGLKDVVAIAAGRGNHSLALKSDGTVWGWGHNWTGQLGDGTLNDRLTPVQINVTGVIAITSGGMGHNIVIKDDFTICAVGDNSHGQLGDGTTFNRALYTCEPFLGTPLSSITSQTDVSCNGGHNGSINLTVSGGKTPYNFVWSNGEKKEDINYLMAETYTVTVIDSRGLFAKESITITEPTKMVASISSSNNNNCQGKCEGIATVHIAGGISPYTYQWHDPATQIGNTAKGLCTGKYYVVVLDSNKCISVTSVTINEPSAITVNAVITDANCKIDDGSITVNASGGTPDYIYSWSDGGYGTTITGLSPGTYTVTVTDSNGCTTNDNIIVNEANTLSTTMMASNTIQGSCNGKATATVEGGAAGYIYRWDDANSQTTETAVDLCNGTYNVTISDAIGCSTTSSVEINEVLETGVWNNDANTNFNIYPNPTYGEITIDLHSEEMQNAEIRIVNVLGQEVYSEKLNKISTVVHKQVNLYGHEKGVYIVDIIQDDKSKLRKRISLL